ncbi:MAG: type II toxin-antitoxin system VapB family antitoxin [Chromatiaceae bacterium]|nr:type II toxin-antitoxin system VapB family antitoxin [Chromatiaceae bacterium]MBP6734786.1 type II toxin-antitoxin system VapB family antitoxin [Chromatiaceae bacterium]MBP6808266.1 type II toxin-antitoxin system VapB family antitoxin [Chromatiaceae bacterium]MBP8290782.1 type II toxin-antitoxin system VapB family antitoxin [Chromatiaceae bacterium]
MRTTLTLDDDLLAQAQQISGLTERTQLIREALLALVQRKSARRLARLGDTEAQLHPIPAARTRRRHDPCRYPEPDHLPPWGPLFLQSGRQLGLGRSGCGAGARDRAQCRGPARGAHHPGKRAVVGVLIG